jgi:type I restriction enzyme, S subunit
VRTYLRAIAAIEYPEPNLVVSTGFAVVRPNDGLSNGFGAYALRSPYFVDNIVARSVCVSYPAVTAGVIATLPVAVPPLPEQRAIADFLGRKTAHIDRLMQAKQRQIELLQEYRSALISHTVTKGLDPSVPMKDSGIALIGEIPAHWEVERNRWLFDEVDDRSSDGTELLLSVSHITGVTPRYEKQVYMFMAESVEGYKRCLSGDLVINTMWAWKGALGVAWEEGIVSPSYHVYRRRDRIEPRYFDYLCRTPEYITSINSWSKGIWSSRLRLYPDAFFEMMTLLPPLEEQQAIVELLERKAAAIDRLVKDTESHIALLGEYRSALISAAVTGQIDVRDAAA